MIRRLAGCVRQYKLPAILAPLIILCESAMEVLIPTLMADLIDYGVEMGDMNYVLITACKLLICALISLSRLGSFTIRDLSRK